MEPSAEASMVSVVIPTYNDADTLPRAIDSALNQTYENVEVIVVDDKSEDETRAVVEPYENEIRYIRHDVNRGGGSARNTGIEAAEGEYIAFLDADDEWLPPKTERQVERLESLSDEWVAAYCGYRDITDGWTTFLSKALPVTPDKAHESALEGGTELIPELLLGQFYSGGASTLTVEARTVEEIGGFDERFPRHQDWEFLVRVLKRGKLTCIDEVLVLKYESGSPSGEAVEAAKERYLEKFSAEVERLQARGIDVIGRHRFRIAQSHFRHGNFRRALSYLPDVSLQSKWHVLALGWAIILGIKNKFAEL